MENLNCALINKKNLNFCAKLPCVVCGTSRGRRESLALQKQAAVCYFALARNILRTGLTVLYEQGDLRVVR